MMSTRPRASFPASFGNGLSAARAHRLDEAETIPRPHKRTPRGGAGGVPRGGGGCGGGGSPGAPPRGRGEGKDGVGGGGAGGARPRTGDRTRRAPEARFIRQ